MRKGTPRLVGPMSTYTSRPFLIFCKGPFNECLETSKDKTHTAWINGLDLHKACIAMSKRLSLDLHPRP